MIWQRHYYDMEETLKNSPEMLYGICVCLLTFVILKYLIPSPTRKQKFIVLLSSGVSLGIIFSTIYETDLGMMIFAFLSAVGLYEMVIKVIMRKLKTSYNNDNR